MNDSEVLHRRRLLALAASLSATAALGGCSLFVRKPTPVCPNAPEVSRPEGPLTIDAHCHVFNGSDLQINEFVRRTLGRQKGLLGIGARAAAPILERIGWSVAPSGSTELKMLSTLANELKSCSPSEHRLRVQSLRSNAFEVAKRNLQAAVATSPEIQTLKAQRLDLGADEVTRARRRLIADIENLGQVSLDQFKALRAAPELSSTADRSARGMLDFILQNFQYRYVSVYDYLTTYDKPENTRVIDLMLPSMVDYDFWLAKGAGTPTSLASQVDVMEGISIATGGRVHSFVPFDPLRQVAFELGHGRDESFKTATEAVERRGCVGIKLYPPMGFAAYGNSNLPRDFWSRRNWLPDWVKSTTDLGARLDAAMLKMLSWCEANEVPVMAHTGISNGPADDFQDLARSEYWSQALHKVPGLRVSFGHFGSSDLGSADGPGTGLAKGFMALMGDGPGAKGRRAYADAGYFVEGLTQEPRLLAALRELYEQNVPGQAPLSTRFMYGTDWEMTLAEGNVVDSYLDRFVKVFDDMRQRPAIQSQRVAALSERFFGFNAVEWIGLRKGERARERLDVFYAKHNVAPPDWMTKVDSGPR
jgi:hypothetical protein